MRMTGISASWARCSEDSQPAPAVADSRITSTPSSMKELKAWICEAWSKLAAGANFSSNPASSLNVSWMFCKDRSEEHTSELQSRGHLVCRLLLEKKKSYSYIFNDIKPLDYAHD